ncbi:MBL fold metallo-hydrolase [Chryseobacterium luquanense]|uniref:MBL fold metallo-hydrolase n=1 Tax=Chryseobacterium luquanense TaxID=2983766 RepID=A0ABT3Y897_9FLAO|nr:MBL fold metallo-hydrolase [Chryseobacterium luquanense]MCX8534338.1 MBL fold metallo-hydrolase [Chryseobacterium luquanense]
MKEIVEDIDELTLEVFTVGYSEKGESQIIILLDKKNDNVRLTFVIDCYSTQTLHKTKDILDVYQIKHIDHFIWTHTDEDHSVGIEILIDHYCDKKTNFYFPEAINGNVEDLVKYNAEVSVCFDKINAFNTGQNYNVHTITLVAGQHNTIFKKQYIDEKTSKNFSFEVLAIAPMSAIIRRRIDTGKIVKKNDFSIASLFKVGELNLLFGGDIENPTISLMPEYLFENLTYIKTPHHTSNTSTKLLHKIESVYNGHKIPTAVSTTYRANSLPDKNLVRDYKKYVNSFISTGDGTAGYGYVKTVYDITKREYSEELFGDATKI